MVSVTQRIRQVTQPRGGYINPKVMEVHFLGADGVVGMVDVTSENVYASLVGSAVDYLTRWCLDHKQPPDIPAAEYVFKIPCAGASRLDRQLGTTYAKRAAGLCRLIDESREFNPDVPSLPTRDAIVAAVELASFDVAFRAGVQAFNPDANTMPDEATIRHIDMMVERSLAFFRQYGPVLVDGFTTLGGYTETVNAGDGDFVTVDTLWDFKVSVNPPTSAHTLQLLMYWLMARRSDWNWTPTWNWDHKTPEADWRKTWDLDEYLLENRAWPDDLHGPVPTHLGIYNPRLHAVYRLAVASIPAETIAEVSRDVIGYE